MQVQCSSRRTCGRWRAFGIIGSNGDVAVSCAWLECCRPQIVPLVLPPSVAPRMCGAEFRHCRKLPYVPQPCPAHPGRNLHFSSTNPGVSNSAPRIRAATAAVTFLWCTDAGDGCYRNPPPWCEMLKCCREGVPCFSAVSLRLCRHPVRRWSGRLFAGVACWRGFLGLCVPFLSVSACVIGVVCGVGFVSCCVGACDGGEAMPCVSPPHGVGVLSLDCWLVFDTPVVVCVF